MPLSFARVVLPDDSDRLVGFLCANQWPFHHTTRPQTADVAHMVFASSDVSSYWAVSDGRDVGLIRLLDLDDSVEGSPLFDVRIAEADRGRGVGGECVQWLTEHLFATYPSLHRVEANTRADNVAMQRVLGRSAYQLEGRLRESWPSEEGLRYDTLIYGLLRTERSR
ncbi:MAG: GNAT family protein [Ilumatobacteraceae bacterium]